MKHYILEPLMYWLTELSLLAQTCTLPPSGPEEEVFHSGLFCCVRSYVVRSELIQAG